MPKRVYSGKDNEGRVFVDCTECRRGWYGDKTCSSGWHHEEPMRGSCFNGVPLPGVLEAVKAQPYTPRIGAFADE